MEHQMLLDKLKKIEEKFANLNNLMSDPSVIANREKYQAYAEEHSEISPLIEKTGQYRKLLEDLESADQILNEESDEDLRELAREEKTEAEGQLAELEQELKLMLVPRDKRDGKNVIVEIRAATGGNEAALFAADLFRMYTRHADARGRKIELLSSSSTDIGGMKEVIFSVSGKGAFGELKYESGVHRVQRVPATEASGRIHTSTVTVAVLAEAEEIEISIAPRDLKIDVFRSSGPGGQSVNTTDSAVRITHAPTGIVVTCQDEKSQHKNRARALRVLRSRLLAKKEEEQAAEISAARRDQVGTGGRSERIRTYNFPQNRVTDHRIGVTLHKLEAILDGGLDELVEKLQIEDQAKKMSAV
jgi:peptide chain release factor 1